MSMPAARGVSREAQLLRLLAKGGVVIYLVVLILGFGLANNAFLQPSTLLAIVNSSAPLMVVAAGMTTCLICAEVDLSVVGVVGLSSTLTASLLFHGVSWPLVLLAAVAAGGAVGMVNGLLTGHLVPVMPFFPSFFPTLATTALTLGIAESLLPSKQAIAISDPAFASVFGFTSLISVPVLYALAVVALMHVMLTWTGLGYRIQAVGANRRAAPLVGINVRWTKFWVLTISGLLSGFAGVLIAGFFQAGYSMLAKGYDLDALGAAVIGGTALFGGRGNVIASISGVLVLAVLNTGLQFIQVEPAVQLAAKGALVIAAVALNLFMLRRLSTL
jgi:ribose/xylose/arabinose/galactoside ABC-type transport system permease subunit